MFISAIIPKLGAYLAQRLGVNQEYTLVAYFGALIVGLGVANFLVDMLLDRALPLPGVPSGAEGEPSMGRCPNCRTRIPIQSEVCPKCGAIFGGSGWKVDAP